MPKRNDKRKLGDTLRIKKLLPELIHEAENIQKDTLYTLLNILTQCMERMKPNSLQVDLEELPHTIKLMCHKALGDEASCALAKSIYMHKKYKGGNYIISPDFFKCFKKISLDKVQFKHLPKHKYGFVELPEPLYDKTGAQIKRFFFSTGSVNEWFNTDDEKTLYMYKERFEQNYQHKSGEYNELVCLAWICEDGDIGYASHPFAEGEIFLKDFLKESTFYANFLRMEGNVRQQGVTDGFSSEIAVMLNILAYLNSGDPDLRQFKNNLKYRSPNSSKVVRRDQDLSQKNMTLVGFGWKKPNLYEKESWEVGPYWARRRHGPKNSMEKLVLVAGSHRQRKSLSENCNTNA